MVNPECRYGYEILIKMDLVFKRFTNLSGGDGDTCGSNHHGGTNMETRLNTSDISRRAVLKNGAIVSGAVLFGATGNVAAQWPIEGTLEMSTERPEARDTIELISDQGLEEGNSRYRAGQTREWITGWPAR